MLQYQEIQNEVESQLFEKLTKEPVKVNVYCKLKTRKDGIKTNFYGQAIPYDMYNLATVVLKVDSVFK